MKLFMDIKNLDLQVVEYNQTTNKFEIQENLDGFLWTELKHGYVEDGRLGFRRNVNFDMESTLYSEKYDILRVRVLLN